MEENKQPVHKYNEKKKVEKIIDGNVKVKEKGIGRRLADIFLSEDAGKVKSYVVSEVIIPAIKDTIVDIVKNGIDMMFYGEAKSGSSKKGGGTYVSYSKYYDQGSKNRPVDTRDRDRGRGNSREFIFDSKGEAEEVLDTMFEIVRDYQAASVADLCGLVGVTPEWQENKWGWYDLSGASVKRIYGRKYILDLPKPMYLE